MIARKNQMSQARPTVFETERLLVRIATEDDIGFFYSLWTNPDAMKYVGFPYGIPITKDEMREKPFERGETEFDQLLVVELKETEQAIGECKLSRPTDEGIAEPDIKFLPEHWGNGYGGEIWMKIVSYLFENTNCDVIQTTPNIENSAAIKIYEAAGAIREGEDVYHFPESMREYTTPLHCFVYRLYRAEWQRTGLK
jgi:RimJ/RimL family protein N-acetyltransferase